MCEKYRCVAIDLRGHGDSTRADRYTIDGDVDDVTAVIAHFGWTKCHLVGMSLGGIVAAHFAAAASYRASSLALIDVAPGVDFEITKPMRDFFDQPIGGMTVDQLVEAAIAAGARGGYDKLLYRYLHMTRLDGDGRLVWRHDPARRRDLGHVLRKLQELTAAAVALECRVLVVRGGRSRILSDDKASEFAARCRHGLWLTIPAAGHNVQEDEPMALAMALREFLSREAETSGPWQCSPYVRP
jgi:pimeloyl-ACP methyl ester carboxylesterase